MVFESIQEEINHWGYGVLPWIGTKVLGLFRRINRAHEYVREINAIADGLDVDRDLLYALNMTYDIPSWAGTHVGCTGFVTWPILARNMDWAWPAGIGEYSMLIRFVDGRNEFLTVGFPGHIGVVSGLSSCGYGITVNQAYSARIIPSWTAMPVTWQVRSIMERARSFSGANRILNVERTLTGAFFLLCGSKPGESLLVESDGDQDVVTRAGKDEYLAIANHYLTEGIGKVDDELEDSVERLEAIEKGLSSCRKMTVTAAKRILSRDPVFYGYTVHQMVMEPGVLHLRCPDISERWGIYRI